MGTGNGSIVLMPAISKRVSRKGAAMTKEQFEREKKYQAALSGVQRAFPAAGYAGIGRHALFFRGLLQCGRRYFFNK